LNLSNDQILAVLKTVIDPNTGTDLVSSKGIKNLQITGSKVHFEVLLGYPSKSQFEVIRQACISAVRGIAGVQQVEVQVGMDYCPHRATGG